MKQGHSNPEKSNAIEGATRELARYEATLRSIGDGVIVTDNLGRIVSLNEAAEYITRWGSAAIGVHVSEVYRVLHERSKKPVVDPASRALESDTPVDPTFHSILVTKDGDEIAVDGSATIVRGPDGTRYGSVLVFRDVERRKHAERELASSSSLAAAVIENGRHAMLVLDAELHVHAANRKFLTTFGCEKDRVLGTSFFELLRGAWDDGDLPARLQEVIESRTQLEDYRYEHEAEHGIRSVFLLNATPIFTDAESRQFLVISIENVTAADNELRRRTQEVDQFVYTVSHDLKSPLVSILGYLAFVREELELGDVAEVHRLLARIERAATQMGTLIDDLLALSRLGSNTGRAPISRIDVRSLIKELATTTLAPQMEAKGVEIEFSSSLPCLVTHRTLVLQAFSNLLTNAIRYGCDEDAKVITVGAKRATNGVQFYVRDHGPGIDPRYHERIFDLFQRLDSRDGSTGVGLAVVVKVMDLLDGRVWVESEPGHGATFWLQVPMTSVVAESLDDLDRTSNA